MMASPIILPTGNDAEGLEAKLLSCALEVQKNLGNQATEQAYRDCFAFEMARRAISFAAKVELMNQKASDPCPSGFRVDFVVDKRVLVDIVRRPTLPAHAVDQYRTYLRLSGLSMAIVINFQADPSALLTRITL